VPMMVVGRRHEIPSPSWRRRQSKDDPKFVLQFRRL
jgi:hypothetical protein